MSTSGKRRKNKQINGPVKKMSFPLCASLLPFQVPKYWMATSIFRCGYLNQFIDPNAEMPLQYTRKLGFTNFLRHSQSDHVDNSYQPAQLFQKALPGVLCPAVLGCLQPHMQACRGFKLTLVNSKVNQVTCYPQRQLPEYLLFCPVLFVRMCAFAWEARQWGWKGDVAAGKCFDTQDLVKG